MANIFYSPLHSPGYFIILSSNVLFLALILVMYIISETVVQ